MEIKKVLNNNNLIFYTGLSLTFLLVFLRLIFNVDVSVLIILVVFGLTILFCDREQIITLAIVCLPLSAVFQYKYALLICVVVYFFKFNEDVTIKRVIIPVLLMLFWEAFHAFFYSTDLKEYLRDFSELIIVVFVMLIPLKNFNYARFIRVFAISCIAVFSILVLYLLKENNFDIYGLFVNDFRLGINNDGKVDSIIYLNANAIGFLCNLSIVGLAQLLLSKNGKIVDLVFIMLLIVFGIMTMSRAFLLCLAIITLICVFMILANFSGRKRLAILGVIVGVGIIAMLIVYLTIPSLIESFVKRFTEEEISGSRIEIFKYYNEHIFSSPKYLLFGIGLQDIAGKIMAIYGVKYFVPHNGIQELVVVWGLPGLLFFGWFIVEMFLQSRKLHKIQLINLLPLILVSINCLFGQLIRSGTTMLALLLVYISIHVKFDAVGDEIEEDDTPTRRTFISKTLNYIRHPAKILRLLNSSGFGWLFSDKFCIKFTYYDRVGVWPNLDNPKTFNEKLNWIKLNDRNPLYTTMVDKIKAKEFVAERIGDDYVIPLLAVWDSAEDIDVTNLPNQFVIKCTHDSGGVIICKDKSKLNLQNVKKKIKKILKTEYFYKSREWPYKNVERKVFAESLLVDSDNSSSSINDYKFFCFNGVPKIMFVATDRDRDCRFDFFNMNFEHLDIENIHPQADKKIEKPEKFEEMKEIAKKLSKGFKAVRVDLYEVGGKIYFGEYTFFHGGAFSKFYPNEWDEKLGKLIKLPIDNSLNKD